MLDISESYGLDIRNYPVNGVGCGHGVENPVYDGNEPGREFVLADAGKLPFDDEAVDIVTAGRFLNNFDEESSEEVIDEVKRVLKPEGYFVGDIKMYRPLRPDQMMQFRKTGALAYLTSEMRQESHEEQLETHFNELETGRSWIIEDERPYVSTLYFKAQK
ncbi:hypothetical protein LC1Nh_0174 [Candidatus Nanohalobium constans]|uniref:Methyltransferase type 11 domain-containing protein n=2 Tax=Candidatus Nanohalobium constans TaxID=2565781 RepID=A0A5Q0UFE0_9ARCH|nr:hypothetical protein LC1Nh_0174 [Candidatus Nanohalobium constans]